LVLAGRSLPTTADSPSRLWQVLNYVAAQKRRSPLATSQLWTLKGTVMGRFATVERWRPMTFRRSQRAGRTGRFRPRQRRCAEGLDALVMSHAESVDSSIFDTIQIGRLSAGFR
jgi:hypothetical protein